MNTVLAERFSSLWQGLGAAGDARAVWRDLEARYAEPHRHYHNLTHLENCCVEFDLARQLAQAPDAIEAAIFFHDAIYDPRAKDNEECSADLATEVLITARLDKEFVGRIAALILDTRHSSPAATPDGELLVDVDLAILGQPRDRFAEYERRIRAEYAWVPEADFGTARAAILQRFLERPKIFGTAFFRNRYEASARDNVIWSINCLVRADRASGVATR